MPKPLARVTLHLTDESTLLVAEVWLAERGYVAATPARVHIADRNGSRAEDYKEQGGVTRARRDPQAIAKKDD